MQKRMRSPAPFLTLQQLDCTYSFYMAGSLEHAHLQSIANKICLSYVTNIPKLMGLACDTFVKMSSENTRHVIFKIFFF